MSLAGCRILVAEDEYLLAEEIAIALNSAGAHVIGPCPDMAQALALLNEHDLIDGAVIDINLRGIQAFDLADALRARNIGFVIATGYDQLALPDHLRDVPRCVKPGSMKRLIGLLSQEVAPKRVGISKTGPNEISGGESVGEA